jgi:hypothetical protein
MNSESTTYMSIEDALIKTLLMNDHGYFRLYGANVCFFRSKGKDSVEIFFPFKVFEFDDKHIADNPMDVAIKLCGYIENMKSYGANMI